jgi:hypothetical protein
MASYALVKARTPLLPMEDVTLGVIVHDKDKVMARFSKSQVLAAACAPLLRRTRFDELEGIFENTLKDGFLTSRDKDGKVVTIQKSDPNFLELVAKYWQDPVLRVEFKGGCPRRAAALDTLFEEEVLNQRVETLSGEQLSLN